MKIKFFTEGKLITFKRKLSLAQKIELMRVVMNYCSNNSNEPINTYNRILKEITKSS